MYSPNQNPAMSNLSKNQHDKLANLSKHLLLTKSDEARKAQPGTLDGLKSASTQPLVHFAKQRNFILNISVRYGQI
jgi:hypothetical protein